MNKLVGESGKSVALLCVLAMLNGCGCGDGASGDAGGQSDATIVEEAFIIDAYCGLVARAACDLQGQCNRNNLFNRELADNSCRKKALMACATEAEPLRRAVNARIARWSGTALEACLAEIAGLTCAEGVTAWGLDRCLEQIGDPGACSRYLFRDSPRTSCQRIIQGLLQVENPCYHELECGPGSHCDLALRCPGRCVPSVELYDSCTPGRRECAPGLDCIGSPGHCAAWAEQDAPCTTQGEGTAAPRCRPPLICLQGKGASLGTCQPRQPAFTGCGDEKGRCQPDLFCHRKSVDTPEGGCFPFFEPEQECDILQGEPPGPCGLGYLCFGERIREGELYYGGTCQPFPRVGWPCSRSVDSCEDSWCSGHLDPIGICKEFKELERSCGYHAECESGLCLTTCQAPSAPNCNRPDTTP